MKTVKIKKNGGPEVLELENIKLRKLVNDEVCLLYTSDAADE